MKNTGIYLIFVMGCLCCPYQAPSPMMSRKIAKSFQLLLQALWVTKIMEEPDVSHFIDSPDLATIIGVQGVSYQEYLDFAQSSREGG